MHLSEKLPTLRHGRVHNDTCLTQYEEVLDAERKMESISKRETWFGSRKIPASRNQDLFDTHESAKQKFGEDAIGIRVAISDNFWGPYGYVINSDEELADFCKLFGIVLFAERLVTHAWLVSSSAEPAPSSEPDNGLLRLYETIAEPEDCDPATLRGIRSEITEICIPSRVCAEIGKKLLDDNYAIRRLSCIPIDRAFVYLDISSFSKFKPRQQVLVLNSLLRILSDEHAWGTTNLFNVEREMLCIGDGYIFVFASAIHAAEFAAHLARLIEVLVALRKLPVPFHFRMSVHHGPVNCFWDPGRENWNFIGEGINGGQRVLGVFDKGLDDAIFISDKVREKLLPINDGVAKRIIQNLEAKGRREDKHGVAWRVYQLNHTRAIPFLPSGFDRVDA